jgi:hypothetical protein
MYKVGQRVLVKGADDWGKHGDGDKGLTGIIVEISPQKSSNGAYMYVYIPKSILETLTTPDSNIEYTWVLRDKDIQPLDQTMFEFMYE